MKTMLVNIPGDTSGTILGSIEIPDCEISRILSKRDVPSSIKIYLIMRTIYPAIDKCSSNEVAGLLGFNPVTVRKMRAKIRQLIKTMEQEKKV